VFYVVRSRTINIISSVISLERILYICNLFPLSIERDVADGVGTLRDRDNKCRKPACFQLAGLLASGRRPISAVVTADLCSSLFVRKLLGRTGLND